MCDRTEACMKNRLAIGKRAGHTLCSWSIPWLLTVLSTTQGRIRHKWHFLWQGYMYEEARKPFAVGAMRKKGGAVGAMPPTHYLSKTRLRPQFEGPHRSVGVKKNCGRQNCLTCLVPMQRGPNKIKRSLCAFLNPLKNLSSLGINTCGENKTSPCTGCLKQNLRRLWRRQSTLFRVTNLGP